MSPQQARSTRTDTLFPTRRSADLMGFPCRLTTKRPLMGVYPLVVAPRVTTALSEKSHNNRHALPTRDERWTTDGRTTDGHPQSCQHKLLCAARCQSLVRFRITACCLA